MGVWWRGMDGGCGQGGCWSFMWGANGCVVDDDGKVWANIGEDEWLWRGRKVAGLLYVEAK